MCSFEAARTEKGTGGRRSTRHTRPHGGLDRSSTPPPNLAERAGVPRATRAVGACFAPAVPALLFGTGRASAVVDLLVTTSDQRPFLALPACSAGVFEGWVAG